MCYASNLALKEVLAYAFCTLGSAQANYTTTKNELLVIVFALNKICSYFLGFKIIVFFDHATLKFLLFAGCFSFKNLIERLETKVPEASKSLKDAKYYVWDDPYLWKFCCDHVDIMDCTRLPTRYWIMGFIGPPFSRMPTTSLPPMCSAKE
ncbi:hypothetical protein CR513_43759, partial [Mucuna pruriens]